MKKRVALPSLLVLCLILSGIVYPTATNADSGGLPSLAEIYEDYFLIGTCISTKDFNNPQRFEVLTSQFNAVTAENTMKPDSLRGTGGTFRFSSADNLMESSQEAGMTLIGHTLVWHQQSPSWLTSGDDGELFTRAQALESLTEHISGIMEHYAGQVYAWDVVNEAMADSGNSEEWRQHIRTDSPWYKAFGNEMAEGEQASDYIEIAFRLARQADPNAVLYYNDYNLNGENKSKVVAQMVKEINDRYLAEGNERLLIEGIGMQGHYNISTTVESVENSIELFKSIGVLVSITELDIQAVSRDNQAGISLENEYRQAYKYAELFQLFKKHSDVIERVTLWGIDDVSSWRSDGHPLLFNGNLTPKQAFYAVANPEEYMEEFEMPEKSESVAGTAAYGTPVLGRGNDPLWDTSEELPVSLLLQAWQTSSGTANVLWDEDNLYVRVTVSKTSGLDNTADDPGSHDSVEVFLDEENCKKGGYSIDDGQFRVNFDGYESFGDNTNSHGFESFATVNDGQNYIIEMKLPFRVIEPALGKRIGFDLQINDATDGVRQGIAKWCDASDNSAEDTSGWGVITLGEAVELPEGVVPLEQGDDEASTAVNVVIPGVIIIVTGILLIVGAVAAVYVLILRRKND